MKIISYNLELDEERKPMLVKEFMCDYVVIHWPVAHVSICSLFRHMTTYKSSHC